MSAKCRTLITQTFELIKRFHTKSSVNKNLHTSFYQTARDSINLAVLEQTWFNSTFWAQIWLNILLPERSLTQFNILSANLTQFGFLRVAWLNSAFWEQTWLNSTFGAKIWLNSAFWEQTWLNSAFESKLDSIQHFERKFDSIRLFESISLTQFSFLSAACRQSRSDLTLLTTLTIRSWLSNTSTVCV